MLGFLLSPKYMKTSDDSILFENWLIQNEHHKFNIRTPSKLFKKFEFLQIDKLDNHKFIFRNSNIIMCIDFKDIIDLYGNTIVVNIKQSNRRKL